MLNDLLISLELGEADLMALWGPDQSLMNYMVLRSKISYYNFAFHGGAPGSHWSSKFDQVDHLLFDKGRQLTYLHYMSVSSQKFNQLCDSIDAEIPYRDLFLHYRYLKAIAERPSTFAPAQQSHPFNQLVKRKISNLKYRLRQISNSK